MEEKKLENTTILETRKINSIKPNLKRAKIAQLFIWLVMILDIISIFFSSRNFARSTMLLLSETEIKTLLILTLSIYYLCYLL